jgi:predicted NBD/HSP70 family sugar kinase
MLGPRVAPDSPGAVLALIRSGAASTRRELAKSLGVSASTAGLRVQSLIDRGYLREAGDGQSHGGRRPRRLEMRPDFGVVGAIDLGSQHSSVALFDMCGTRLFDQTRKARISDGPHTVLKRAHADLTRNLGSVKPLRGIAVGVPGPVDTRTGRVVSPSRMPGWNNVSVRAELARLTPLPVIVDNDANLMAIGEHTVDPVEHMVFVKAGTGIGCGVIASGRPHRGAVGAAGDISHLPVPGREEIRCSCGRNGCLDAVASSAALFRDLEAAGVPITNPDEVILLAGNAHPTAMRMLREAGRATGEILAPVVNFFNPDALVIGGLLSRAEAYVASLRAAVYERCFPMATEHLQVRVTRTKQLAGLTGGAHLMLEYLLDPERVNEEVDNGG